MSENKDTPESEHYCEGYYCSCDTAKEMREREAAGPSRLDAIAARVAAATPGPWRVVEGDDCTSYIYAGAEEVGIGWDSRFGSRDGNPDLIANAPADLRYLLAIARAAERLAKYVGGRGFDHLDDDMHEMDCKFINDGGGLSHYECIEDCDIGRARVELKALRAALEAKEDVR